jgi:hypothetical protein
MERRATWSSGARHGSIWCSLSTWKEKDEGVLVTASGKWARATGGLPCERKRGNLDGLLG